MTKSVMPDQSYLIFTLNGERFAIDALPVRESIYLPELTPVEEVPPFIAGAFNFRGKIVHVIDLHLLLGHPHRRYHVSDMVIVVDLNGSLSGVIVSNVLDVITIRANDIEETPDHRFITGEAKVGGDIVMILDNRAIADCLLQPYPFHNGEAADKKRGFAFEDPIFHDRARALIQPPGSLTLGGLTPLAVVGLNSEYYGIDLESVSEFSNARDVTPVPCTPPHIIGNMNLRGDILTLVDIRGMLNLPHAESACLNKVIVTHTNGLIAGIMVDEVFEVVYLSPSDIIPVPSMVRTNNEYITGEASYAGKMLSILDLKKILTKDDLIVSDEA